MFAVGLSYMAFITPRYVPSMSLLSGDFLKILYYWLLWIFTAMQAFSSCHERGLLLVAVCRLLIAGASLMSELQLQAVGSAVGSMGFSSCTQAQRSELTGSRVQVRQLWCSGLAVLLYTGSFQTRDLETRVPCIGWQILNQMHFQGIPWCASRQEYCSGLPRPHPG